jgi:hypothetical protein
VRNDEVAFGAKPTSMGGQGWVAQSRLTPTGRSANPARIRLSDGHAAMTMTTRAVIAEGNFIVAGSAAIQKPHSLYCFMARRNREPIWTKSTSRHSFPRRFSPKTVAPKVLKIYSPTLFARKRPGVRWKAGAKRPTKRCGLSFGAPANHNPTQIYQLPD